MVNNVDVSFAFSVMESSDWPSVGLFGGTLDHLGNWEECMMISSRGVKGQYCLVQAKYTVSNRLMNRTVIESRKPDGKPDENDSTWNAIEWVCILYFQSKTTVNFFSPAENFLEDENKLFCDVRFVDLRPIVFFTPNFVHS